MSGKKIVTKLTKLMENKLSTNLTI